jgi:hypothetical protein
MAGKVVAWPACSQNRTYANGTASDGTKHVKASNKLEYVRILVGAE